MDPSEAVAACYQMFADLSGEPSAMNHGKVTTCGYNTPRIVFLYLAMLVILALGVHTMVYPDQTYTAFLFAPPGIYLLYTSIAGMVIFLAAWTRILFRAVFVRPAIIVSHESIRFETWKSFSIAKCDIVSSEGLFEDGKYLVIQTSKRHKPLRFALGLFDEKAAGLLIAAIGKSGACRSPDYP